MSSSTLAKYPCYAADLWKSRAKEYYVAISMHWIDDFWRLHSPTVAMPQIKERHTAENVGTLIGKTLEPFLGNCITPYTGVLDGGDISSVPFTAKYVTHLF